MTRVITGMVFACLLAGTASARGEEGANWLVPLGSAVSHTAHICQLKDGATMEDIARIDERLHESLRDRSVTGLRQIVTPLFAVNAGYDYLAFMWSTWEEFGDLWNWITGTPEGQAMAHAWDDYESCEAVVSSVFPLLRQAVQEVSGPQVATAEWCTRKDGISQEQLGAKHRSIADANRENPLVAWWGVGYPQGGARTDAFPGEFFHLVTYRDMAAYAGAKQAIADGGWRERGDYYSAYADCTGEHVLSVQNVFRGNGR